MTANYFQIAELHEIENLLIEGGVDSAGQISSLLVSMDQTYKATLPSSSILSNHLLLILDEMNQTGRLQNGEVPMRTFLINAVEITRPRPQSTRLSVFLATLEAKLAQEESAPAPTDPSAPSSQAQGASIASGGTTSSISVDEIDLSDLVDKIEGAFGLEDLRDLSFNLNIDFESIPGQSKSAKARELVLYCKRRGLLLDLITELAAQRPNMVWTS